MKATALAYLRAGVAPIPCCHPDPRGGFLREDDDGFDPNEPKYRRCVEHRGHRTKDGMDGKAVGKTPLTRFAAYQHQLPPEEQVAQWWTLWPDANVAILTGNQYVVFDVDNPEALREAHDRGGLEDAPVQRTGHGYHYAFAAPDEELRNFAGRERKGFDGRANGGFVMAAPSMHANGRRYEWLAGDIPDFADLPPLPSWLRDLWRKKPTPSRASGESGSDGLDDWVPLDLDQIALGVEEGSRNHTAYRYASRLRGKAWDLDDAKMALLGYANRCNPPMDEAEVLDIVERVWERHPAGERAVDGAQLDEDDEAAVDGPMPFPVDALPPSMARYVAEAAASVVAPPDLVAVPLLVAAGAVVGKRCEVAFKSDWHEGPNLYALYVGEPGTKKTPAANKGLDPLRRLQTRLGRKHAKQLDGWHDLHAIWERDRRSKQAGREPKQPPFPHLLTTEATVEALVPMLKDSPGVVMAMDEGVAWVRAMNQYKAGGKGADRQHFLSFWGRVDVKVDRKGNLHEPIMVSRPCLSVIGGIQPDLLSGLVDPSGNDGFVDRILWSWPEDMDDSWEEAAISQDAKDDMEALFELLRRLGYDEDHLDGPAPVVVNLVPEAKERLISWYGENAAEKKAVARELRNVWSKMPSQLGRLALVLHAGETVAPQDPDATLDDVIAGRCKTHVAAELSLATLESAIRLVDYFKAHARRVHGALHRRRPDRAEGAGPVSLIRRKVLKALRDADRLSKTELLRDVLGNNVKAPDLDEVLDELEADGEIVREVVRGDGRPTTYWRLAKTAQAGAA
jgi:hypothetical protein